jgi:hypothetical protein
MYKWTGTGLQLMSSPLLGITRLVSCLSIIRNQYMLIGNVRKGLAFIQVKEAKGTLTLLSKDFSIGDAVAVEFLLFGQSLAFCQGDSHGNLAIFRYDRTNTPAYEPTGLRAVLVGHYHLAHKVPPCFSCMLPTSRRTRLQDRCPAYISNNSCNANNKKLAFHVS